MSKLEGIDENTKISLTVMAVLVPVVIWLANVNFETHANTQEIHEVKEYQSRRREVGDRILERLSSIEAKLDSIEKYQHHR